MLASSNVQLLSNVSKSEAERGQQLAGQAELYTK